MSEVERFLADVRKFEPVGAGGIITWETKMCVLASDHARIVSELREQLRLANIDSAAMEAERNDLRAQLNDARQALTWYADKANYRYYEMSPRVYEDRGARAKAALDAMQPKP